MTVRHITCKKVYQ